MRKLMKIGLISLVLGVFLAANWIDDSYAARYGRGFGSYSTYRSTSGYRSYKPTPKTPSYTRTGRMPMAKASGSNNFRSRSFNAPRALPKSIPATSSVARMTKYSGKVTKTGSPIISSRSGKTFSIPKQGVFSSRMSLMSGVSRTALINNLGSSKASALQTRIVALSSSVGAARNPGSIAKASSAVWKGFSKYRGDIKTNGLNGKGRQFYQWDHTHGDIEVYDSRRKHIGSMNPQTGEMYKPAVKGRKLED